VKIQLRRGRQDNSRCRFGGRGAELLLEEEGEEVNGKKPKVGSITLRDPEEDW